MQAALLDTDMLSEVMRKRNATVQQHAAAYLQQFGTLTFSAITRYEVIRGYKQKGATAQLAKFAVLCSHCQIVPVTDVVLDRASDLWMLASQGGHPRGDADLFIAASAMELGLELVTGNTPHFAWIPGLACRDWRQP
jgi:tRNA(fMet)-specific endonuclease VapC